MPRFFYIACDDIYGGLYGMCDYGVIDAYDVDEARNEALQAALEVINSFSNIYEHLEADVRERMELEDDFDELYEEACYEDAEYELWCIDENKAENFSTEELNEISYSMRGDKEEFIRKFCRY